MDIKSVTSGLKSQLGGGAAQGSIYLKKADDSGGVIDHFINGRK
jgi:hypothetical protein